MEKRIVTGRGRAAAWTAPVIAGALGLACVQACGQSAPSLVGTPGDGGASQGADRSAEGSIFVTGPAEGGSGDGGCDPTAEPRADACVLTESEGVFVAAAASVVAPSGDAGDGDAGGNDGSAAAADAGAGGGDAGVGDGSRAAPFTSIGAALAHLNGKSRVYVCNGDYSEAVRVTSAVSMFGGLTCAGGAWHWVGGTARVTTPALAAGLSSVALVVQATTGSVTIEDMSFTSGAPAGHGAGGNGASSIAAQVNTTATRFVRTVLTARDASNGADGVTGVPIADGGVDPSNYDPADARAPSNDGSAPGSITCVFADDAGTHDMSSGGNGGDPSGVPEGGNGTSVPAAVFVSGVTPTNRDGAGGQLPHAGEDGVSRSGGATATFAGVLTASGWQPTSGGAGLTGQPGQGGGGESVVIGSVPGRGGASGGCGGAGGAGGGGGGASVALAVLNASVTLQACTLTSGRGGDGGQGGAGQSGQQGGVVLSGGTGLGGNGAGGSGGAGGSAGVSVGILYSVGSVLSYNATDTVIIPGPAGQAGAGGAAGTQTNAGGNSGMPGYLDAHASAATLSAMSSP